MWCSFISRAEKADKTLPQSDCRILLLLLEKRAVLVANRRFGERSPDTDDDWIIGIALESRADFLVTQNTADIQQALFRPSEIVRVLTLGAFLHLLEE